LQKDGKALFYKAAKQKASSEDYH